MRYLLFPFRWIDEKFQGVVDRCAFRLMDHLECERRVLMLMLSLLMVASFVPLAAAILTKDGTFLGKVTITIFLCYGAWNALTLHAQTDSDPARWRFYVLTRVMVASMKLLIVGGILLWAISGAPYAELTAPTAASLMMGAMAMLCATYLQRTPLSRPVAKTEAPEPISKSAPAES